MTARTDALGRTTTYSYAANGIDLLEVRQTTAYAYDAYGRVRTVTADEATVTADSDVFDRPTVVTYPDGTTERTTYDRLDVAARTDRLGRVTRYLHDPLRRRVPVRDPAGRAAAPHRVVLDLGKSGVRKRTTASSLWGGARTMPRLFRSGGLS